MYTRGEDAEDFDSLTFTALDKVYPDFEQVIEQFTAQYRAMSEAGKLKLSTNTIVEDVIYQQSKDLAAIIQPHFWILDPDDPDVQSWFTTEEWDELKSKRLPLRRPDTNMVSQMAKFAGVSSPMLTSSALQKNSQSVGKNSRRLSGHRRNTSASPGRGL